jgi:2'-5' RNA ligase
MTRGATARLFVAVDPPAEVCEELLAWGRRALSSISRRGAKPVDGDARLLDTDALHVTLCFLGSRPVAEIEPIGSALAGCASPVGELSLGAPLWLPPRGPRVLAVELHDREGGLRRLHEEVCGALSEAIGWQPERRRFRAHITVARVRGAGRRRRRRSAEPARGRRDAGGCHEAEQRALPATPPLRFTPSKVVLYRSWLSRTGASYEALATCELLGAER